MSRRRDDTESAEATVRVLIAALEAAGEKVRREVLVRMLEDEDLRDEIEAVILWEERKHEQSRPLREILARQVNPSDK